MSGIFHYHCWKLPSDVLKKKVHPPQWINSSYKADISLQCQWWIFPSKCWKIPSRSVNYPTIPTNSLEGRHLDFIQCRDGGRNGLSEYTVILLAQCLTGEVKKKLTVMIIFQICNLAKTQKFCVFLTVFLLSKRQRWALKNLLRQSLKMIFKRILLSHILASYRFILFI